MLGRWNQFCGQNDEVQYQPVAGDVVDVPAVQDNTELFNQIPADVLVLIASKLSKFDLIPFFLTNKKLFRLFEDFSGNTKHGELRVWQLTSPESVYQGASAEVNFRDVNHVLMAQYFLNIKMHELESHQVEMTRQDAIKDCLVVGGSIALGIVIGAALQAGAAALLDKVVLPACFKCCVTNSTAQQAECLCGGNISNVADPVLVGRVLGNGGEVVGRMYYSLSQYRGLHLTLYSLGLLPITCSTGCCFGWAPICTSRGDSILGDNYHAKHTKLSDHISHFHSSQKAAFTDIIELNTQLRERKIGGEVYRLFHAPVAIKMEDEPLVIENNNHAPQAPQRMSME